MLKLENPQAEVERIAAFIKHTFAQQHKTKAVVAVSGGIDSSLSLTLTVQALGAENVTGILLPYGEQAIAVSQEIIAFNHLPPSNVVQLNVKPMVDAAAQTLSVTPGEIIRFGNLKARSRMICIYDTAKKSDALVCGTENKSEHYLGYFTRFGDAASDLEPICHLYKTQVRQVASHLQLPEEIIAQAPSAGLWEGQTDEVEMGFTYQQADEILEQLIDQHVAETQIVGDPNVVTKVVNQVKNMNFKLQVPYQAEGK